MKRNRWESGQCGEALAFLFLVPVLAGIIGGSIVGSIENSKKQELARREIEASTKMTYAIENFNYSVVGAGQGSSRPEAEVYVRITNSGSTTVYACVTVSVIYNVTLSAPPFSKNTDTMHLDKCNNFVPGTNISMRYEMHGNNYIVPETPFGGWAIDAQPVNICVYRSLTGSAQTAPEWVTSLYSSACSW